MVSRLLGNENRLVLWSFGLELAAIHMAVCYTQLVELGQHPIIRQALRRCGGRDFLLAADSGIAIPIALAATILTGGKLDLRPKGVRDLAVEMEFMRRVWERYGPDILAHDLGSWKGPAFSRRYLGHGPCQESRLRVDVNGEYLELSMRGERKFIDTRGKPLTGFEANHRYTNRLGWVAFESECVDRNLHISHLQRTLVQVQEAFKPRTVDSRAKIPPSRSLWPLRDIMISASDGHVVALEKSGMRSTT